MKNKDSLSPPDYAESMETTYCLSRRYGSLTYDEVLANTRQALEQSGFEIVSELAMHDYFKERLNKEINRYTLLGACHAQLAYDLLQKENKLGVLMPCNVIVQDLEDRQMVEVSIVDTSTYWQEADSELVKQKAIETKEKLKAIFTQVEQTNVKL
jgi:uncharacterized protein (DUF302 family)